MKGKSRRFELESGRDAWRILWPRWKIRGVFYGDDVKNADDIRIKIW